MPGLESDSDYKRWADEHLIYEAGMFKYAARRLAAMTFQQTAGTAVAENDVNAFLESFTVHARCLIDFFWGTPRLDDASAADFCPSGVWERERGPIPDEVSKVNRRVGKEIAHLTYARLDIPEEAKNWKFGLVFYELAGVFERFADLAEEDRLSPETRNTLGTLRQGFSI